MRAESPMPQSYILKETITSFRAPLMKTVLVPIDFSPISKRVAHLAVALARGVGGRLVFLHVVQPPSVVTEYGGMTLEDTAQLMMDARKWAGRKLVQLRSRLRSQNVGAGTILETGAPVPCILAEAKKLKASHIVMGSHGHTAFYDLLVGGTTHGVLKRANCPVVVVPARESRGRPAKKKVRS
jgi:universal stress protein A